MNYRYEGAIASCVAYRMQWLVKREKPILVGDVAQRLKDILNETATELNCKILSIDIRPDMVRLEIDAPVSISPKQISDRLKTKSASILREEFQACRSLPSVWTQSINTVSIGLAA